MSALRRTYYNPILDGEPEEGYEADSERGGPLEAPTAERPANLVSSLCADGLHRPALDIDMPVTLVESSTPGHHHLYLDTVALPWWKYKKLLVVLAECGIIEQAYCDASIARRQTLLRPPGVTRCVPRNPEPPQRQSVTITMLDAAGNPVGEPAVISSFVSPILTPDDF